MMFGSYGGDQCLDLVETALKSGRGLPRPEGDDLARGDRRRALRCSKSGPPTRAPLRRRRSSCWPTGTLSSRGWLRPRWATARPHSHCQLAGIGAQYARRQHRHHKRRHRQDALRYGHVHQHRNGEVAGRGVEKTAKALRDKSLELCKALCRLRCLGMSASGTIPLSAPTAETPLARAPMRKEPRRATAST